MAPSSPSAELAALAAVEAAWRDALSFVAAGEVDAALHAVTQAGGLLARLAPADATRARLSQEELVEHAARTERLLALHAELARASGERRDDLKRQIDGAARGRRTLAAYGAQAAERSLACDALA